MSDLFINGPYKQVNGAAITVNSTKVGGGSMKSASTQNDLVRPVTPQQGNNLSPVLVAGVDAGQADWGAFVGATGSGITNGIINGAGDYLGLARVNRIPHGVVVGQAVNVQNTSTAASTTGIYNGIHRVVAVVDASGFIINTPYVYAATGINYASPVGVMGYQGVNNYSIVTVPGTVHGVANAKITSPGSDYGRDKIYAVRAIRTQKVATAVRAGQFVPVSGKFSTQPGQSEDLASMGADDVLTDSVTKFGTKGEYVMRYGAPSGLVGDYDGKTN